MAKKSYPAWQYYLAAGIAVAIGLRLFFAVSWLFGGIIILGGVVVLMLGLKRTLAGPAEA